MSLELVLTWSAVIWIALILAVARRLIETKLGPEHDDGGGAGPVRALLGAGGLVLVCASIFSILMVGFVLFVLELGGSIWR